MHRPTAHKPAHGERSDAVLAVKQAENNRWTTQFKIFPCRAKRRGPRPVRTGSAATSMRCSAAKARAASRKTPQIASSQPRPPGAGPLSARAGRKIANTANSPMEGRAEPRHFPHTAAVCRPPAHFTRQRPARLTHPRHASVSFAHRRAAREAKAAPHTLHRRAITGFQRPAPSTPLASARPAARALYAPASRVPHTPAPRIPWASPTGAPHVKPKLRLIPAPPALIRAAHL